jgi:hypothetical protein
LRNFFIFIYKMQATRVVLALALLVSFLAHAVNLALVDKVRKGEKPVESHVKAALGFGGLGLVGVLVCVALLAGVVGGVRLSSAPLTLRSYLA